MAPTEKPKCETCGDGGGWILTDNPTGGAPIAKPCEDCRAAARGHAPGVPVEERPATFDTYAEDADNREALKHARYFVDGIHPGLYVYGPTGTGKTKLACCALNAIHASGRARVLFTRVPEVLLRMQPSQQGDEPDGFMDRLATVPVLALDDVGASQGTDFARRTLQILIDRRLDAGLRTIWTSNLSLDDLEEFLGDARLPSRIAGSSKIVRLDGNDRRVAKKRRGVPAGQQRLRSE